MIEYSNPTKKATRQVEPEQVRELAKNHQQRKERIEGAYLDSQFGFEPKQ